MSFRDYLKRVGLTRGDAAQLRDDDEAAFARRPSVMGLLEQEFRTKVDPELGTAFLQKLRKDDLSAAAFLRDCITQYVKEQTWDQRIAEEKARQAAGNIHAAKIRPNSEP